MAPKRPSRMAPMRKPRKTSLPAFTNRPTPSYRERILGSFGGAANFMNANHINPNYVLAKSWTNFKLTEMETAEQERIGSAGNEVGVEFAPYEIRFREKAGQDDPNKRASVEIEEKGKGKKTGREMGFDDMKIDTNLHGIKPYDDGVFEDANAIMGQQRGTKWERSDDEQDLRANPQEMGKRRRKDVVGKFDGVENFMNFHGIKPYDDGVFDAEAILGQIQRIKKEPRRVAKKKKWSGRSKWVKKAI